MPLSYVRWYCRRELAHGRLLIMVNPPAYAHMPDFAFLVGKERESEDIPLRTARSIIKQGEVVVVALPDFGMNPMYYAAYKTSPKGWDAAAKTVFGTHRFWSWFGGSYGFSKTKLMRLMMDLQEKDHPFPYSPPTLKEWGTRL